MWSFDLYRNSDSYRGAKGWLEGRGEIVDIAWSLLIKLSGKSKLVPTPLVPGLYKKFIKMAQSRK